MEAASINWEQGLFEGERAYVERQLAAGVERAKVISDLVGMGADANRAAFFVDTTAKQLGKARPLPLLADARSLRAYLLWAVAAVLLGVLGGAALVFGVGLEVTREAVRAGAPSVWTIARIEAASLLPGVLVGVLLRRHLCPTLRWRPVVAGFSALVAIMAVRVFTNAEVLHEAAAQGEGARMALVTSTDVLRKFVAAPTNVYGVWSSTRVAPLVLWDAGFVGLAAFVAAVLSRHPSEP